MTRESPLSRGSEHVHPALAAAYARFHVPSAREIDGWLYLTGVIAARQEGDKSEFGDGFERAFGQIAEVLAMAGCNWNHVAAITSHHLDIGAQVNAMAQIKDRYCDKPPFPAWSILGSSHFVNPNGFCEIVVVARKP